MAVEILPDGTIRIVAPNTDNVVSDSRGRTADAPEIVL